MSRDTQCEACGATIFKEQLDSGVARYEGGKLLCMACVEEFERAHDRPSSGGSGYHFEPIAMRDDPPSDVRSGSGAAAAVGGAFAGVTRGAAHLKRPLDPTAAGATRCRTFHCKLNDAAIEFLNGVINQWLDEHADITVKFATSTLGVFEGKNKEPNLILTLFY